jgi:hypothetical protein
MATPWRSSVDQARTIARATFDGFLQSDLMPSGMQAPALIWAAVFLVAPALFFPVQFMMKYPFLRRFHPDQVEGALWDDRMLFLLMSAGAMGLVSVVLWETLFPARRDAFVLTPMPVALSVQMLGRLMGLVSLCLAFVVALNVVPAFTFPVVSSAGFSEMPREMIGHLVASVSADAFVFFSITALQGLVILGFGRRAAVRLAAVAQAGVVLVMLLTLLFIAPIRELATDAIVRGNLSDPALRFFPPTWFLGLYSFIAGTPRPLMTGLAGRALLAAFLPFAVTVAIYAFGYKRLLVRAVETPPRSTRSSLVTVFSRIVRTVVVRRPEEQAICAFMLRAIARSARHSMLMSIYVGGGLAMIVTAVIPALLRSGAAAFTSPGVTTLSAPLVVSAALAVGVRIIMTIPADMSARWIFQTTALTPRRVDAAAHKALLLIVLPPVVLTAGVSAWILWGPAIAVRHAVFCASLAVLLCEILLLRFRGVPLTRPYVPGRSRFHMLWAFYLSAFITYTYSMAGLEAELLGHGGVLIASGVVTALALGTWALHKRKVRAWDDVPFDADIPDEMFRGFNLTEAYAARAVAARRDRDPRATSDQGPRDQGPRDQGPGNANARSTFPV